MMKKKVFITGAAACLLILAAVLTIVFTGAFSKRSDPAAPVIRSGDTVYTKADVERLVDLYLTQQAEQERIFYGREVSDHTSKQAVKHAQDVVIDTLVQEIVIHQHARALGVEPLPESYVQQVDEEIVRVGTMMSDTYYGGVPQDLSDEERREYLEYMYYLYGVQYNQGVGYSRSMLLEAKVHELVQADAVKDVPGSDEEKQAAYEQILQAWTIDADVTIDRSVL